MAPLGTIIGAVVTSASTRKVDITINLSIAFLDPQGTYLNMYSNYRSNGIGIYFRIGNNPNWNLAIVPFHSTQPDSNGWWRGGGTWVYNHTLTQQEWDTYAIGEEVIYDGGKFEWIKIPDQAGGYDYDVDGYYDTVQRLYPASRVYEGKIAITQEYAYNQEKYWAWRGMVDNLSGDKHFVWKSTTKRNYTLEVYASVSNNNSSNLPHANNFDFGKVAVVYSDTLQPAYYEVFPGYDLTPTAEVAVDYVYNIPFGYDRPTDTTIVQLAGQATNHPLNTLVVLRETNPNYPDYWLHYYVMVLDNVNLGWQYYKCVEIE